MKNSKEAWVVFRKVLFVLFLIFLVNYFIVSSGYYESQVHRKTILTEESIREFEEDVKNNEYIDIKDYLKDDYVDTSNVMSKSGVKFSETINDFVTNKTIKFFKLVGKLFG